MRKKIKKKIFVVVILVGLILSAFFRLKYIYENDEMGNFIDEYFDEISQ